ncbi:MAG: hypothetical protein JXR03_19870 [Cyclobacteriaceae bacterium]
MYKKICVVTSSYYSFPLIHHLKQQGLLEQVLLHPKGVLMQEAIQNMIQPLSLAIIGDTTRPNVTNSCDLVIVIGYPDKIRWTHNAKIVNVHFGPLPENRGPDPVFWTLRNGKNLAYVAIHELTDQWDAGLVLKEKSVDIMSGENYGLLSSRLSHLSVSLLSEVISGGSKPREQEQDRVQYNSRPDTEDCMIKWSEMSALQVESLVRACNPVHGGAKACLRGTIVSFHEVEPAEINLPKDQNYEPGTIVHSSAKEGLFVICKDLKYLKINVLSLNEGIFSGNKLAALGTPAGTMFT